MWGRESINTPIKVKRSVKDPLHDPQGPNLTGGFGDALTTALDVMAFTHDLDIVGASQGLNLATNTKTTTTVTTTATTTTTTNVVTVNNQMNSALSVQQKAIAGAGVGALAMIGTVSQLTESQGYIQNLVSKKDDIKVTTLEDPFRELVINSNNSNFDPEQLKVLALSAANLENIEETTIAKQQTKSVKSLAGIFAGTETFVRKVEETIKKKYAALDPSDSEGFGGA